jgi:hypothetical protein
MVFCDRYQSPMIGILISDADPPNSIVTALDRADVAWLAAPPVRTLWTW